MFSNLPWSHQSDQAQKPEDGESLTSVLSTPELRSELTLLIASCTQSMRKTITDAFDAEQTGKPLDVVSDLTGDDALRNVDPATAKPEEYDRQRKEKEQREKELSEPKMRELNQAALEHFDTWRDSVLQRVGEVVNSRHEATAQKKEAKAKDPKIEDKKITEPEHQKDEGVETVLRNLYPPLGTQLSKLEEEKRALVLHSMLLLLLSLESYSSYSRVLMLHLVASLRLDVGFLAEDEAKIARGLLKAAEEMSADSETKKKAEENASARKWKVGLASVAGAAIIGVTGGLAAPLLAAGVGSVMGGLGLGATAAAGYLGTLASSTVLVGGLFGAYGARMTGQMMDQYAREVSDFAFIPVHTFHKPRKIESEYRRLRVAIGISGWLTDREDVVKPWRVLSPSIEGFALRWELDALLSLGNAITTMIKSYAWGYAKSEIIKRTVFASLTAALWPLGLLKVSKIVDNPFSIAKSRSEKAGAVLADALINKAQGERPVTLIGYSLGARVIYTCLMTLAERKAFGLVESVVLLGAPTPSDAADWRKIRSVVAGRVVNVYSENDSVLAFLYRTSSIQYGVAGLQAVEGVKGVQNVDVSEIVQGHTRYRYLTGSILKKIGFEDLDAEMVVREEQDLKAMEEKEKQEEQQGEKGAEDPEKEAERLEKEVQKRNEESKAKAKVERPPSK